MKKIYLILSVFWLSSLFSVSPPDQLILTPGNSFFVFSQKSQLSKSSTDQEPAVHNQQNSFRIASSSFNQKNKHDPTFVLVFDWNSSFSIFILRGLLLILFILHFGEQSLNFLFLHKHSSFPRNIQFKYIQSGM